MGKPKTKTVGGGAATPVANSWNQFLGQGLSSGSFGANSIPYNSGTTNGQGGLGGTGNVQRDLNAFNASRNPGGNGIPNAFGGAIDQLLSGNQPKFGDAPTLQNANFNPNATNLDLSGNNYNPNSMNLQQLLGAGFNMGNSGQGQQAQAGFAQTQANGVPNFFGNQTQLGQVNMNDPQFAALAQKLQQDTALGLANTRERFGGNALNSGASLAEAQYNAQANPANILAMGQLGAQMRGLNLADFTGQENAYAQRLGLGSQSQLGNRGMSSNEAIANAGNQTQASLANANNALQYGQLGMQGQGQILDYLLGSGRLGLDSAQGNAQNAYNAFNANNNANQNNNANAFNQAQMANNFNQQNFGQQSQNILGGFNAAQNGQLGAMGNIFGAMGQSNQLGTPQAQTVEVQNPWMQGLQALGGIAQGAGSLYGAFKGNQGYGNMGGGGNSGTPNWQIPQMPGSLGGGGIPSQSMPAQWGRSGLMAPQGESAQPFNQQSMNNQSAVMQQLQQNPQLLYQLMQQSMGGR